MSGYPKGAIAVGYGLHHATLGHISVTLKPAAGGFSYEVHGYRGVLLAQGSLGAGGVHWARDQAIADAVARHERRTCTECEGEGGCWAHSATDAAVTVRP